jgi:hypothetical protein
MRPPRLSPTLRRPVASTPRTVEIALDVAMHMRRRYRGRGDSRGLEACQAITQSAGSIAGVVQSCRSGARRGGTGGGEAAEATGPLRPPPALHRAPPPPSMLDLQRQAHVAPSPPHMNTSVAPELHRLRHPRRRPPHRRRSHRACHRWQIWPPGRHAQQELREEGREEGGAAKNTRPPRLPLTRLCPPHRHHRPPHRCQARPPRHHRYREWGGGSNRGHPAFQAAPTRSTTRLRLRRPTPSNPAACAARTGRLAPPSG